MEYKKFKKYLVYEDGRVYSLKRERFLKPDITKQGYAQYSLNINGEAKRYKAHKLVALLFLERQSDCTAFIINHKDGNKLNNHKDNLEWCTYEQNNAHARRTKLNNISKTNSDRWNDPSFRKRTSKNISKGLIRNGSSKGERNGRFRYRIFDDDDNLYSREDLSKKLNLSQSYIDTLIRRAANGISNEYFDNFKIYVADVKHKS